MVTFLPKDSETHLSIEPVWFLYLFAWDNCYEYAFWERERQQHEEAYYLFFEKSVVKWFENILTINMARVVAEKRGEMRIRLVFRSYFPTTSDI